MLVPLTILRKVTLIDVACIIIIIWATLQRAVPRREATVERFTAAVPFLISAGGDGPDTLQQGQALTSSPLFYMNLVPAEATSDLQVIDACSGNRVWGVTMVGRAQTVTVGEGNFFAKDEAGAILWSSPAPTGPNGGGPFKLAVAVSGALQLTDKNGSIVFSTPVPRSPVPELAAPVEPLREALVAAPAPTPLQKSLIAGAALRQKAPILLGPDFLIPTGPYGAPRLFYES
jgi:hypothetical protein